MVTRNRVKSKGMIYCTLMPKNNVPVGGFTEGELKFASFWVRHGDTLRRAVRWFVIAVVAVTWGYVLWTIVDAYAISYPRESRLTEEMWRNQHAIAGLESDAPAGIQTGSVSVFSATDGRLDLAVDAQNRNEQWWAEFTYHFNVAGEQTPRRTGFIMPQSETFVTELGYRPSAPGSRAAQLVVEDVRWHRVDPEQTGGRYADYELERFNVAFENRTFERITVGDRQVGNTSFDLVNRGAYGYWNVGLVLRVLRGGSVLGVNKITLTEVVPGETRHVNVQWFEPLPPVTEIEIIPIVNFLDPDAYLPTERF